MSIPQANDRGHHRRIINTSSSDPLNESDTRDSLLSTSAGLYKQSSVDSVTEFRKKYDMELLEDDKCTYQGTFWTQSRALLQKNFALQSKQKGTNICQILIPLSCLVITLIFKLLAKQELNKIYTFDVGMPYFFNVPYSKVYNQSLSPLKTSTCLEWYLYDFKNDASQETKSYIHRDGGLLSNILPDDQDARKYFMCPEYKREMPYFEKAKEKGINEQMFESLQEINSQAFDDDVDTAGLDILPDGAITFYEANDKSLSYKLQINDVRLAEYHRGNGVSKIYLQQNSKSEKIRNTLRVTDGQLIMLDLMSKAYIQNHNKKVVMVSASQYMPFTTSEETIVLKIMSILGATLYPVALSVIMPVFLYSLVLEKEERLRQMMKMNGMKMTNYWIINYIWNLLLSLVSSLIFLFFGAYVLRLPFFVETSPWVLLSMILGWSLSQVSLSFFFQNFMARVRSATIIGYLLSIWTCVVAVSFNVGIYPYPNHLPWQMKFYPPLAFCRLIYSLSIRCSNYVCVRGFFEVDQEMKECLFVLYAGAVVLMVLGLYLDKVWPQEYGVTKSPLYFLKSWFKRKNKNEASPYSVLDDSKASNQALSAVLQMTEEDEDVGHEREYVEKLQNSSLNEYPLVVKHLRKVYKPVGGRPAKVAVQDISLHIKKGEMFGLLGPNGAGKTSLISMITGLYPPESGNAWIGGYDIVNQIDKVHSRMGVCPQFDLLWPELTVEEHLIFYSQIRGVSKQNQRAVVAKALQDVRLTKFAKFATQQLSGGMKRRLSVAISFVGNPQVVLLDEPTTGLDPDNRRQLWDILVEARKDRALVLTTHSMEEADVLCTRIGIIVSGALKCIGPQTRLKSKYGGGYQLIIHCHKDKYLHAYGNSTNMKENAAYYHAKVLEYIQTVLPNAVLKSSFHGSFLFQIPMEGLEVSKIFEELELKKDELAISDWGISQSTLEDVFMEIVKFVEENNQT